MKESFDEYKKTIENNVISFTYLYDGDVIDSEIRYYEEIRNTDNLSPIFIINCIKRIYDESVEMMFNREHKEVTIIKEKFDGITNTVNKLHNKNFYPTYVFCSNNYFNLKRTNFFKNENITFPSYFYKKVLVSSYGFDIYECPLIKDKLDDIHIYATDRSIQSLVYTIQNMEYKVESNNGKYKHIIKYNLYNCDYNVYKIYIKDLSKIRDEKINIILDGENN